MLQQYWQRFAGAGAGAAVGAAAAGAAAAAAGAGADGATLCAAHVLQCGLEASNQEPQTWHTPRLFAWYCTENSAAPRFDPIK